MLRPSALALATVAIVAASLTVAGLLLFGGDRPAAVERVRPGVTPAAAPAPQTLPPASVTTAPAVPATEAPAPRTPAIPRSRMIGQKIMVGFRNQANPPPALLTAIRRGRVGGVILFKENNGAGRGYAVVVAQLQKAAREGHNPPLLISIDQEGGDVRRIADAPPSASPREMGRAGAAESLRQGQATGEELRRRGITVDLAPVADVPSSPSSFLGSRAFGTDPAVVAATAGQFAKGLQGAGVAATAKHYPGLGTTGASNTDNGVVRVTTPAGELSKRAKPFHQLAHDGIRLIMVSNAIYPALDPDGPAVLSPTIVDKRLRSFFPGRVVISDALDVPALRQYGSRVPVLASRAGVDVLLYSDTSGQGAFHLLDRAYATGELPRGQLRASYTRIIALKSWIARFG